MAYKTLRRGHLKVSDILVLGSTPKIAIILLLAFTALILGVTISLPKDSREFVVVKVKGSTVVAEVARDPSSRARGLSGRDSLPEALGMLFIFETASYPSIWMKAMKFPLDIIWVRNGKIVDLEENAPPPTVSSRTESLPIYTPDVPARLVLEVNAGFAKKFGIHIGDEVKIFSEKGAALEFYDSSLDAGGEEGGVSGNDGESRLPLPGQEYFIETGRAKFYRGTNFKVGGNFVAERGV